MLNYFGVFLGKGMFVSAQGKILLGAAVSFVITYLAIPTIIRVARMTGWLDPVGERKLHHRPIPRLGGVAIFAAVSVSLLLLFPAEEPFFNYFIAAMIILFFIGVKDDILITAPLTKFSGQLVAVSIPVLLGRVQITNLHGFFHIFSIPAWLGAPLTIFVFLVIINAFNFIDGIDGLAATIAIEVAAAFGIWFYYRHIYEYSLMSAVLIGSLLAYLRFNLSRGENKIFMGDTGTMIIGLVLGVLAVEFNEFALRFADLRYFPAPAVSFGIMIVPFYDMLRIIFVRSLMGKKFFEPDQNHIHHVFIRLGLSHLQTLIILAGVNLLFIFLSFYLAKIFTIRRLLLILLILIGIIVYIPAHILRKKEENE